MLVVRKEGKAHDRYNSFRSAFELLESVEREPHDCFEEDENDLLPLQRLELRMQRHMQRHMNDMQQEMQKQIGELKQENVVQHQNMQQNIDMQQQQIGELNQENTALRSRLQNVESRDAEKTSNAEELCLESV